MDHNARVGLGLEMGMIGVEQEPARQSPPPSALHPEHSIDMSRSSSCSISDMSDLSVSSAGSPTARLNASSPSTSTYSSPWMPSGGFSPDTSSFSHFPSTHTEVVARATKIRQKKQRRLLNKLAIYLPKPLKPLAASSARLLGTLAAGSVLIILCLSAFSATDDTNVAKHYLPDSTRVHDLYRSATGREPPSFIASFISPRQGVASEAILSSLHRRDQQHFETPRPVDDEVSEDLLPQAAESEELSNLREELAKVQANLDDLRLEKKRTELSDKCGSRGCNTCGNRGCDPEGYLRSKDVLRSGEAQPTFRGRQHCYRLTKS